LRQQALRQLEQFEVLMRNGHFDYGNGFHGRVYLNPHQLFRHPSTIWRLAQDLLEVLPVDLLEKTEVVAGPVMGGALLAHTLAGLLDGRRALTHPPCSFAPFSSRGDHDFTLRGFYAREMAVLEHLLRRSNRVVAKNLLETSLYGLSQEIGSNAVEVYVHRLRKHLTEIGASVQVHTVRGVGYLIAEEK